MTATPVRPEATPIHDLPAGAWTGQARVRFAHCDPAGIVYFARHFEIVHGVIEDWLREALGLSHADIIGRRRIGLGYAHARADFFAPAFAGDRLEAAVLVGRIGRSSMALTVPAYRDGTPVLKAELVMVTTSLDTHTVIELPDDLRAAASRYAASLTAAA